MATHSLGREVVHQRLRLDEHRQQFPGDRLVEATCVPIAAQPSRTRKSGAWRGCLPCSSRQINQKGCDTMSNHIRAEIQRHQVIPRDPRLEPDQAAQRRRPMPAGEAALTVIRPERPAPCRAVVRNLL